MKRVLPLLLFALLLSACSLTSPKTSTNQTERQPLETESEEKSITGSIKEIMGMGQSLKCSWSQSQDNQEIRGSVYISGNKFRQTVFMPIENETVEVNSISDSEYIYTWGGFGGENQGTKFKIAEFSNITPPPADEGSPSGSVNLEEKLDFKCSPWIVDQSLLVPPTNINFVDQSEIMKKATEQMKNSGADICAICDQAPNEAARAQCRSSANCE